MTLDLTQTMREHGVPGASVAVLRDGRVVEQRAFGVRADGEPGPVAAVDLDADVNEVLTGWQTVRRGDAIVLHQSGLETVCPRLTFT